jgi:hypothetical protein
VQGQLDLGGKLGVGRLTSVAGGQHRHRAPDLALALEDVDRDPDGPRLVGDAALDRLPDPGSRIRGELQPAAPVELLDRADQAQDPLLDQVGERDLLTAVVLGDGDHEAQVRVDHSLLGGEVTALDPLGELDLLLGREQAVPADLVQEQLQGVGFEQGL